MLLQLMAATLCCITFATDHTTNASEKIKLMSAKIKRIKELNEKIIEDFKSLEKYDWEEYHRHYEEIEYYNRTISSPFCKTIFSPTKQKID